jgi:hypothetical protein
VHVGLSRVGCVCWFKQSAPCMLVSAELAVHVGLSRVGSACWFKHNRQCMLV